jgi:GT2 family glycosyltransferase
MTPEVRLSVVIPNFNGSLLLGRCIRSVMVGARPNVEIIVVDNGSTDDSVGAALREAPGATIVRQPGNVGFTGAANAGIRVSRGRWVALLNNDTEVAPSWLNECTAAIDRHPEAAFLACRILDYGCRDRLFSAGDCFLRAGVGYRRGQDLADGVRHASECEVFSACGCAALYRRAVLQELRGFDDHFFAYLEDVELALRFQAAGYRGYYVPSACVYHVGSATAGGEFSALSVRLRTRNAILLLFKSLPLSVLWRCLPAIATAQLTWMVRALAHKRAVSYARGLAAAAALAPAMLRKRRELRASWRRANRSLWNRILESEQMARADYADPATGGSSRFMAWYFRHF